MNSLLVVEETVFHSRLQSYDFFPRYETLILNTLFWVFQILSHTALCHQHLLARDVVVG